MMLSKTALVLEGGGFRGVFSAGVVDVMMAGELLYPYVIGVSMGAIVGANYVAKQPERTYDVARDYMQDKRYMGFGNLIREGSYFSSSFAYREIPRRYNIFDIKTYYESPVEFYMTATNCKTGKARYFEKMEAEASALLEASSALPFISKMVMIDGEPYMDGGVADSVPIAKAIADGNEKIVVVLTREAGYRKEPYINPKIVDLRYRGSYPDFAQAIEDRHLRYNETMVLIEALEAQGKIFVIRPPEAIETKMIDRDPENLAKSYAMGKEQMEKQWQELAFYLSV